VTKRGRRGGGTVFYDKSRGRYVGQLSLGFDDEGNRKRGPKVYGKPPPSAGISSMASARN